MPWEKSVRRGRWEKSQNENQDGREISWASKSWSDNWSNGWKGSSSGSWKEDKTWSKPWYKSASWSEPREQSSSREPSVHTSDDEHEEAPTHTEPVRRVTLLARPATTDRASPPNRAERSERTQNHRRVLSIHRLLCPRSPGRAPGSSANRALPDERSCEGEQERLVEPSPGSPMSVGSSVIPHGRDIQKPADQEQDEDDGSASDNFVALPVELLDDSEIPGPVRPEQGKEARRQKDAAEAAKFAAPNAKNRSSGSAPAVSSSVPRRKKQRTMATATQGTVNEQPFRSTAASSGSTNSNSVNDADSWRESSRGTASKEREALERTAKQREASKRTAAKVQKEPTWEDLSDAEIAKFKEKMLDRLRTILIEEEDSAIVAEIVVVMLGDNRPREEFSKELAFMEKETEPFLSWVEEYKSEMLSQKRAPEPAQSTPTPPHDAPPGDNRAVSTGRARKRKRKKEKKNKYVVVTSRLKLQPNAQNACRESDSEEAKRTCARMEKQSGSSSSSDSSGSSDEDAPAQGKEVNTAEEKRIALLTEMTTRLQAILLKLSDKNLDDLSREKYQAMALRMQETISKCGRPSDDGFDFFQMGETFDGGPW